MRPPRFGSKPGKPDPLEAFVEVRCLCGRSHTHLRDSTLEGLGTERWKCGGCKRRYIIACTPGVGDEPDSFWPLFLEDVPSTGSTRQEGLSTDGASLPEAPPELHFRCRCGCRLVGKSHIYGHRLRCPRCASPLIVRLGYESDQGRPIAILEYPDSGGSA